MFIKYIHPLLSLSLILLELTDVNHLILNWILNFFWCNPSWKGVNSLTSLSLFYVNPLERGNLLDINLSCSSSSVVCHPLLRVLDQIRHTSFSIITFPSSHYSQQYGLWNVSSIMIVVSGSWTNECNYVVTTNVPLREVQLLQYLSRRVTQQCVVEYLNVLITSLSA